MPAPAPSWSTVRVHGTWVNQDGSLKAGTYEVKIPVRVTNATDDVIIPAGTFAKGTLNTTNGLPSLDLQIPATDDPDNLPNFQVQITVTFPDALGEQYQIDVPIALQDDASGIDLRAVVLASTFTPTAALIRGVPGGIAGLDAGGRVVDADGNVITAPDLSGYTTTTDFTAGLSNKVNTSTYTAGLATKADVIRRDVRSLGVPADGTTDATSALQAALDLHVPLVLGPGTYRTTGALLLDAGADIEVSSGATVVKDYAATSTTIDSWIRNRDLTTKTNRIRISGGGEFRASSTSNTGNLFALYGDDILVRDIKVTQWAGGRAWVLAGDRMRVLNVWTSGSPATAGNGGMRFFGGKNFRAIGCHVESGDDALQLVPSGNNTDPLYDQSISDSYYIGCTGGSGSARLLIVAIQAGSPAVEGDVSLTSSVTDSGFIACTGYAKSAASVTQNLNSSGQIRNINTTDCTIEKIGACTWPGEVYVKQAANVGAVRDLTFTRVRVVGASRTTFAASTLTDNIKFTDCNAERGSDATWAVASLAGSNGAIEGGVYDGLDSTSADVIAVTSAANAVVAPRVVKGIGQGRSGVSVTSSTRTRVNGARFVQTAGATTAKAVTVASTSSNADVRNNDVSGFGIALPVADSGTSTLLGNNLGQADPSTTTLALGATLIADEAPVNNSAAVVTSPTLTVPVVANAVYAFRADIIYDSSTTADLKLGWILPAGCSGTWTPDGPAANSTVATGVSANRTPVDIASKINVGGVGVGTSVVAKPTGVVRTGSTAGSFAFQYAQQVADPTNTTLHAGSTLTLVRIA